MNFRFAPGARLDLFDLMDWHEARTPGAGARLTTAFADTQRVVLANPRMFGRAGRRRAGVGSGS
jgi:hypothetical protein